MLSDLTVMPLLLRRYLIASPIDSATLFASAGTTRKQTAPSGEVASTPSPSSLLCHLSGIWMVAIGSSAGTLCVAESAGVTRATQRNAANFRMAVFRSSSFERQIAFGRMGKLTTKILQRQRCNIGFKLVCL